MSATLGGAAAAAAGGLFLFDYNRGNFLFDAELRYERFVSAREYAIAQTEQYRSDILALSKLTQQRVGMYMTMASLDIALCIACYCAGRLGLHGPSPPVWYMSLWLTNNAGSFAFMVVSIFLSLHAHFRAQTAAVSLLTRRVRVPVPSLKQLDKARKFGSEFEQQKWSDIFRVPYLMNNGVPKVDAEVSKGRARSMSPGASKSKKKATSWIREELETDQAGTVTGAFNLSGLPDDAAPEHFQLYTNVQKDWFQYDIYARVTLLYGFVCLLNALAFYGIGHICVELKAFWVMFACPFLIAFIHALLLKFDIVSGQNKKRKERLKYCEYLGPISVMFCAAGMALDFAVEYNRIYIYITWLIVFITYAMQFVYHLRMLEIILPDEIGQSLQLEEKFGTPQWPREWRVPSMFSHVLYWVMPPEKLQPGQNDLVRELKLGTSAGAWEKIEGANATSSGGPGLAEDLAAQVVYVDRLFEWAFSAQIFDNMTAVSRERVRELYHSFAEARAAGPESPSLPKSLQECLTGLESITAEEGLALGGAAVSETESSGSDDGEGIPKIARPSRKAAPSTGAICAIQPWKMAALVQLTLTCTWIFLTGAIIVDCIMGEQALLTAPHWSRPPLTRPAQGFHDLVTPIGFGFPASAIPAIPEQMAWHEEKRERGKVKLGSPYRRLSTADAPPAGNMRGALTSLLNSLSSPASGSQAKLAPQQVNVEWPTFFQPKIIACGPQGRIAALTPRGVGAVANMEQSGKAEAFSLGGVSHLPPLLSAAWGPRNERAQEGLMLVTRQGHLAACPGTPPAAGGIWSCSNMENRLPIAEGANLVAATVAWLSQTEGTRLHAALVDGNFPHLVSLYVLDDAEAPTWLPLGEVQMPHGKVARVSLSFIDGDLLVTTADGDVIRRRMQDGALMASASHLVAAKDSSSEATWHAACGLPKGVAHLQARRYAGSHAWRPELLALTELAEILQ